jgi:hypothetical protein
MPISQLPSPVLAPNLPPEPIQPLLFLDNNIPPSFVATAISPMRPNVPPQANAYNPNNLLMLNVETNFGKHQQPPEVVIAHPSPNNNIHMPTVLPHQQTLLSGEARKDPGQNQLIRPENTLPPEPLLHQLDPIMDDEMYLPLVLEHSPSTRSESVTTPDEDGPATVIPLITELGIKDSSDDWKYAFLRNLFVLNKLVFVRSFSTLLLNVSCAIAYWFVEQITVSTSSISH